MLDTELMQLALLHLMASHRDHARFMRELRAAYLNPSTDSVEIERREPLWNELADAVNHITGLRNGGVR